MTRILLIGSDGFIGRYVHKQLVSDNHDVMPLVKRRRHTDHHSIECDLTEGFDCLQRTVNSKPDVIIHLAAAVPGNLDYKDDDDTAELTKTIDMTVYQFAKYASAYVIYASGCSLYDNKTDFIKDEGSAICPSTPYLNAKAVGESLFQRLDDVCITRISSPYGPNISSRVVLGKFLSQSLDGDEIQIWGSGQREQDFIHNSDICSFISLAIAKRALGVFNVCYGRAVRMKELANCSCRQKILAPIFKR